MVILSHEIAASIVAACSSTFIGHPLDTIKVHLQNQSHTGQNLHIKYINSPYPRLLNSFQIIQRLSAQNPWSLFHGIGPPIFNQIIMNTVMFSVFQKIKTIHFSFDSKTNMNASHLDENKSTNTSAMMAGLISGFATAFISTPTDWVKIQAQLNIYRGGYRNNAGQSFFESQSSQILHQLLKTNHYNLWKVTRILYRGHVVNLWREGVFTMIYLGLYDQISRSYMDGYGYKYGVEFKKDEEREALTHNINQKQKMTLWHVTIISSFTGACAWICNYPFDTCKSIIQGRLQTQNVQINMMKSFQIIWKNGGLKAFYRGIIPSTARAILVTSTRMLAYEWTQKQLNKK